jgi:hypothetical protein
MTNPFDDVGGSTNPFDDSNVISTNPFNTSNSSFDDDGMGGTRTTDGGDEDYMIDDDPNLLHADAPVEASWQYLGDLPYRRVPVYNNVLWGDRSNTNGEDSDESKKGNNLDVLNYGLSAFPKAALQRHPDLMNPRELRELLNTSTVTKV